MPRPSPSRVLIVDDHPVTREGIAATIRHVLPGATSIVVGSIAEAVNAVECSPAKLIILDYHLPDAHGYSGFLRLQHLQPTTPILIFNENDDPVLIAAAKALGASGYLQKSASIDDLARALQTLVTGGTSFPTEAGPSATIDAVRAKLADLSWAQRRVLLALTEGHSNKRIAHQLDVTEATVKAHLTSVFRTLGVQNRAQALLAASSILRPTGTEG